MHGKILFIACIIVLSGCESDQDRMVKAMERRIATTIHQDWHAGIPLDDLVTVHGYCSKMPALKGCTEIQVQMEDISISLTSCQADPNSALCKSFSHVVGQHTISSLLPKTYAAELPHTPFYWAMPTAALQAQAAHFGYRQEVASFWWTTWSPMLLSCIALLIAVVSIWFGWSRWETKKLQHAALLAQQRAIQADRERARRAELEQAQIEAEHQARLKHEAEVAEQQHTAALREAERLAAETAAKQVAERVETASLIEAAFTPTKNKRRKNASTSN